MTTSIHQYVKRLKHTKTFDPKNLRVKETYHWNKVGLFLAEKVYPMMDGRSVVFIGWSKCRSTVPMNEPNAKPDVFNKEEAFRIAKERILKGDRNPYPPCFKVEYEQFYARCVKYFQNCYVAPLKKQGKLPIMR